MTTALAAQIFTVLTTVIVLFQVCLICGLPWGQASMGGKFPGKYPIKMRFVAAVNILLLLFIVIIVLSRAHLIFPAMMPFSKIAIWGVVAFCFLGAILNTITPSKIERIWAPVAFIQLLISMYVALY